jgi:hypothetical protein
LTRLLASIPSGRFCSGPFWRRILNSPKLRRSPHSSQIGPIKRAKIDHAKKTSVAGAEYHDVDSYESWFGGA